ncbi:MAG TPA: glycosyltransferase family 4 protein [Pontiellaceae bacterium]|nr:glycosyltransferase family 4 protein [Pontiellaceae bacterium]
MPTNTPSKTTNHQPAEKRRLRVLISAYACEPNKGSEPGVGWNIATEMAKLHDVWVLTRANNRTVIEDELARHPVPGLSFFYYDLPKWACWWKKGGRGVQLYYYLWQMTAVSKVRKKHAEIRFDLCHHITFVKYWAPSCLAWLKIPFVWGPVGGGDSTPVRFLRDAGLKGMIYEIVRDGIRHCAFLDPFVRFTAKRSSSCIAVTEKTAACVNRLNRSLSPMLITQVGISERELQEIDQILPAEGKKTEITFLFVGNLLFLKGVHLGLKAFAESALSKARFLIVGDGPERRALESLAEELGISGRVHFLGQRSRNEVLSIMKSVDALIHPSLHDSGGFVLVEAMACRKPVLCLDLAGPALLVPENAGIRVQADTPVQVSRDIAAGMQRWVANPELRMRMGDAGREMIESQLLWSKKTASFSDLYAAVLKDF